MWTFITLSMNEIADIDIEHAAYMAFKHPSPLCTVFSVSCCKSVALAYHSFVFFHLFLTFCYSHRTKVCLKWNVHLIWFLFTLVINHIFKGLGFKTKQNTGARIRCTEISITICVYNGCTTFNNTNNLEQ